MSNSNEEIKEYNESLKDKSGIHKLKAKLYNSMIDKYTNRNKRFEFSDVVVWKGSIYELPTIISYILFFLLFLFIGHLSLERYGWERTIIFFILLVVWRIQMLIKVMNALNKKFE